MSNGTFSYSDVSKSSSYEAAKVAYNKAVSVNERLSSWCAENDTTMIDGAKIYTGSVTAQQIDVTDLFAQDITATGTIEGVTLKGATGSFTGNIVLAKDDDKQTSIVIDSYGKIRITDDSTDGETGELAISSTDGSYLVNLNRYNLGMIKNSNDKQYYAQYEADGIIFNYDDNNGTTIFRHFLMDSDGTCSLSCDEIQAYKGISVNVTNEIVSKLSMFSTVKTSSDELSATFDPGLVIKSGSSSDTYPNAYPAIRFVNDTKSELLLYNGTSGRFEQGYGGIKVLAFKSEIENLSNEIATSVSTKSLTCKLLTCTDVLNSTGNTSVAGLTSTGKITSSEEIISSSADAFRACYGNYGFIIRNDSAGLYFLLTNSGDPYGTFNSLRPFMITLSDGTVYLSTSVKSSGIYNTTTSAAANMYISPQNFLKRSTSASKYKLDIKDIEQGDALAYNILRVSPRQWFDRSAIETYSEYLTDVANDTVDEEKDYREDDVNLNPYYGFIAEDLVEAGLSSFCEYKTNEDGTQELEGIQYDRLPILFVPILRDLVTCMQKILPLAKDSITDADTLSIITEIQNRFALFSDDSIVRNEYAVDIQL